ncbi:hypothetical protein V495_07319 [Pseudogymnoascus sp. VKM F-4514 (FW-929)]|nr:hypothetical protein V495_07319 [Pseudogymnoascus sp. VKM F-4514 (FW-929)]KFY66220.1 hypothetical protein V497_01062 [Pseudogymnoascus sp. VKM F-4516 (FW-969)]
MVTIGQLYGRAIDLASNPAHSRWQSPILLLLDALLCLVIIWKVPYTEIDWEAYMQQVAQFLSGEHDYVKIAGGTGPLVYPAVHVYIYSGLYWLTDEGRDIKLAQGIFAGLYLLTLGGVMACYRRAKAPPYIFPMLILSKRLHSIYILRCFNDCFAVLFLWMAIYAYQRRSYTTGTIIYSLGLGVKMSLLLVLPALGIVFLLTNGIWTGLQQATIMAQLQILFSTPFALENVRGYYGRAFEFSRVFLFKWTVNWRFIGEEVFLSKGFSTALLLGHINVLAIFAVTRWLKTAGRPIETMITRTLSFQEPLGNVQNLVARRVTPQYVLTTILTANVIGILFARSLHYQFYAYLAWSTPFLLWRSGMHPILQYALWAAQEWAWNVYPSTDLSSQVVVGVLALTVAGVWWGTGREEYAEIRPEVRDDVK